MDTLRMEAFLFIAETLNFTEAARQLHLSQSTISHRIKVLENELGLELFDRSGSGICLTEAGRSLIPWAGRLVRNSMEIQNMMASFEDKIIGHLRIACSTTSGKYILPKLAARFHNLYPWVKVTILSCTPEYVIPRLLEDEANLGVLSREAYQEGLEIQDFFTDQIVLIVPPNHPWVFRKCIEPEDLIDIPLIIREATSGTRQVMLRELGKSDIHLDDLNIFLELGNAEAIVETVAAGFGVSFISRIATACAIRERRVVAVPFGDYKLERKVYMVRRTFKTPIRAQEAFWGFVHDSSNRDLLHMPEQP